MDKQVQRPWIVSAKDLSQKLKNQVPQQVVATLWKRSSCACAAQAPQATQLLIDIALIDWKYIHTLLFYACPASVYSLQFFHLKPHKRSFPHETVREPQIFCTVHFCFLKWSYSFTFWMEMYAACAALFSIYHLPIVSLHTESLYNIKRDSKHFI